MRYFIDTEFLEDGVTIDLISIGIVAEDGREYYAQSAEFLERHRSTPWLDTHVIPHLGNQWLERASIKDEALAFMNARQYGIPELIGWCCAYDFVAFCHLFGTMMDVPTHMPHCMHDIQQTLDERGIPDEMLPQQEGTAHNALSDARHIRQIWQWLQTRQY